MNQIDRLLTIMQRLRDPENGCPWDKEQTFATIAPYTLEETYEVLDAIAREDFDDLRGELGDLLFQVVFYAQMAQEEGRFDFNDICAAISDKLERRHPHVFADSSAENSSEVLTRWEQIKTEERAQKAQHSALDDIPRSLPALMRAQKIQKRCANVGFDWTTLGPVVDKVYEEIDEVMYEARQAVIDQAKLEEEMGRPAVCHGQSGSSFRDKSGNRIAKSERKIRASFSRSGAYCCRAWTGNDRC